MIVVGEKLNATNKSVGEAIAKRDQGFIENLARAQDEAGADYIDVNAGQSAASGDDVAAMKWLLGVVQGVTEKPLAIDSDSAKVIAGALEVYKGNDIMINSVSAEPERLEVIGKLAAERGARLVALAMGAEGIPETVKKRLEACRVIMDHLGTLGMAPEAIFFDPLVLPVSVDTAQGLVTLETIREIKAKIPGAKTVMGLSNISFGMPSRKLINRGFMLMSAYAGLDAAIMDPLDAKMMSVVKAADLLMNQDTGGRRFIRAYRQEKITE